ncbi:MAG TPA: hypothetical protein VGR35_20335 [Tepidisphaeraceae bacterium]|nr:hypothetical protein [Tepidisphaeraceae bacterium]
MAERNDDNSNEIEQRETATKSTTPPMEGAVGAGDASSGGGAGAGTPDGDLAERAGDAVTRGDVRQDREKIFPEADETRRPGADAREA